MRKAVKGISQFCGIICYCIKTLWEVSRKYFVIRLVLVCLSVVVPFAVIILSRTVINVLVGSNESDTAIQSFLMLSVLLLVLNILNKAVETTNTYYEGLQRDKMDTVTKHRIMKKAAELDLSFFDSSAFYNEVNDADRNSPLITFTAFQAMDLIRYFAQFTIAFVCLFQSHPMMPFIFVLSVVPCTIVQIKQVETIYGFQRQYMSEERKMQYASELLLSREFAKDVRIYNMFPFISRKFLDIWNTLFAKKRKISLWYTKLLLLLSALPELTAAFFLFLLGLSVIQGGRTIGDFSFLQGIMAQTLSGLYMVISSYAQLADGKMRIQNYRKFLGLKSKIRADGTLELKESSFMVEFKNVSFRYGSGQPWILKNVSFSFHSSQNVALVGTNGSGKTTIVKLLLRFYDPEEGQIFMGGRDIREYTLESVRRHFSAVFQDYSNYAFTVRESVSLSDASRAGEEEQVIGALKNSGADSFTARFPKKLDTYLTRRYDESGQELSGGQWQKIAIARAFFREADIYILDEPSAALDAQSEDEVFRTFQELYTGKGAVLISHRLSNIHLSDLILVLEQGVLVEAGRHEELMKVKGIYAHMYHLQAEKYNCL